MGKHFFETLTGAVVLAAAGLFLFFAYHSSNARSIDGYALTAQFGTVAGVGVGSDVRVGGIKVGSVSAMTLDPKSYKAVLHLQIKNDVQLPADSSAAVASDGLLGSKYVKIEPGADDKMLAENASIAYTQSSVNLEEMIGKMVFSGGGVDKNGGKKDPAPAPTPASPDTAHP